MTDAAVTEPVVGFRAWKPDTHGPQHARPVALFAVEDRAVPIGGHVVKSSSAFGIAAAGLRPPARKGAVAPPREHAPLGQQVWYRPQVARRTM